HVARARERGLAPETLVDRHGDLRRASARAPPGSGREGKTYTVPRGRDQERRRLALEEDEVARSDAERARDRVALGVEQEDDLAALACERLPGRGALGDHDLGVLEGGAQLGAGE